MTNVFTPPLDDISAALTATGLDDILRLPAFEALERSSVKDVLGAFADFVASEVAPSLKVTVPLGVPAPGAIALTVAVRVTD